MATLTGREERILAGPSPTGARTEVAGTGALRGDVRLIKEVALEPERAVTPRGATVDGVFYALEPFEADVAVVWAVKVALSDNLTPEEAEGLQRALDSLDENRAEFLEGAVSGIAEGARVVVRENLEGAIKLLEGIVSFYSLATDPEIWVRVWQVWNAREGSEEGLEEVADYLRSDYPGLWAAMVGFPRLHAAMEKFFGDLEEEGAVADFCSGLRDALLETLRRSGQKKVREFVALTGEPEQQGAMVGEAAAVAVISAVLVAMDVRSLARSLVKMGHSLMEVPEAAAALKGVVARSGELGRGAKALKLIEEEAERLYQKLAREIKPYKHLKKQTGEFNRHVAAHVAFADQSTLGVQIEYIGLRLDADHILEDRVFDAYAAEFRKLGWSSADDMPSIAIHTEYHIRSGEGMTDVFHIQDTGITGKTSLTEAKLKHFPHASEIRQKYPTLLRLVEGYEEFYKGQRAVVNGRTIEGLWPRLEPWFASIKAEIASRGL